MLTVALKAPKKKRSMSRTSSHQIYKTDKGVRVPGASTVAKVGEDSGALLHWAWQCGQKGEDYRSVRDNAATIGTIAHFMIENEILGCDHDLDNFAPKDIDKAENSFLKFLEFWDNAGLQAYATERQLVDSDLKFGGTLDAVCVDAQGKYCLVDWKTSKGIYDSYKCQLSAYEHLWNLHNPERQISRRVIARIGKEEEGDFEVQWYSEMTKWFELFKAKLGLYYALKAVK